MSHRLDELFINPIGPNTVEIQPYTDRLDRLVESCPEASVVMESQEWSRLAAIQMGNCTIYEPSEVEAEELPFNPTEVAAQITYCWRGEKFDLAWIATWTYEEGGAA